MFTYGAAAPASQVVAGRPTTAAVHYHLAEHHLACATRVHAEQTHPDYYPSMEKDFPTLDVKFERHKWFADIHARLAETRTHGAVLVHHHLGGQSYVGDEARAWNDELRGHPRRDPVD